MVTQHVTLAVRRAGKTMKIRKTENTLYSGGLK